MHRMNLIYERGNVQKTNILFKSKIIVEQQQLNPRNIKKFIVPIRFYRHKNVWRCHVSCSVARQANQLLLFS